MIRKDHLREKEVGIWCKNYRRKKGRKITSQEEEIKVTPNTEIIMKEETKTPGSKPAKKKKLKKIKKSKKTPKKPNPSNHSKYSKETIHTKISQVSQNSQSPIFVSKSPKFPRPPEFSKFSKSSKIGKKFNFEKPISKPNPQIHNPQIPAARRLSNSIPLDSSCSSHTHLPPIESTYRVYDTSRGFVSHLLQNPSLTTPLTHL